MDRIEGFAIELLSVKQLTEVSSRMDLYNIVCRQFVCLKICSMALNLNSVSLQTFEMKCFQGILKISYRYVA